MMLSRARPVTVVPNSVALVSSVSMNRYSSFALHFGMNMYSKPPPTVQAIFDVSLRNTGLSFAQKDGNDTNRFEMRLLNDGTAELMMILTDEDRKELAAQGVGVPKLRLKKARALIRLVAGAMPRMDI